LDPQKLIKAFETTVFVRTYFKKKEWDLIVIGEKICFFYPKTPNAQYHPDYFSNEFPPIAKLSSYPEPLSFTSFPLNTENIDNTSCDICHGKGQVSYISCKECGGDGNINLFYDGPYNLYEDDQTCLHCSGTGKILPESSETLPCAECYGTGLFFDNHLIEEIDLFLPEFSLSALMTTEITEIRIGKSTEGIGKFYFDTPHGEGFGFTMLVRRD
jgi:hypothetical protein